MVYHEFQDQSCVFLWVSEMFSSAMVYNMIKNFQFDFKAFTLSNITSVVLQIPVIWCPNVLNAVKICMITLI
jgi:hypothetical protein